MKKKMIVCDTEQKIHKVKEDMVEQEIERMCVCACVCERERERERN